MTPVTRQCCGTSPAAATTRAWMLTRPSPLNAASASQAFCGDVSAVVYDAADDLALANGCAAAGTAATSTSRLALRTRITLPPPGSVTAAAP
jgi:hypothetical protein